ncbi:hypothetical protein ACFLXX_03520 [Chloroflexota bacterium]
MAPPTGSAVHLVSTMGITRKSILQVAGLSLDEPSSAWGVLHNNKVVLS